MASTARLTRRRRGNSAFHRGELAVWIGLGVLACTGSRGSTGEQGREALVEVTPEPSGSNCEQGGQRIDTGMDADGNGVLRKSEIDNTTYVCVGATGTAALVNVVSEPAGDHCAYGGQRIEQGADSDGDGELDQSEVDGTDYVCSPAATDDPVLLQRLVWSQTAKEPYMTRHSDELVDSAPPGNGRLTLSRISNTPRTKFGFGKGACEIVAYNPDTHQVFQADSFAEVVQLHTLGEDGSIGEPSGTISVLDNVSGLEPARFGVNSVALSDNILAVGIEVRDEDGVQQSGRAALYDVSGTTPKYLEAVTIGALPDMLTFTHDGKKLVVCDEGEPPMIELGPSFDYAKDPEGSIAIVDRPEGGWAKVTNKDVTLLDFKDFNDGGSRESERPAEIHRIAPEGTTWAQQFEPEYAAVHPNDKTAWVSLQEQNTIAVVDLTKNAIKELRYLGVKDGLLPGNEFDASNTDGRVRLASWPVYMMYQPDTIYAYRARDKQVYYVTANEGDPRNTDWSWYEIEKVSGIELDPAAFPGKDPWQSNDMLGSLIVTTTAGDSDGDGLYENLYAFGGRSFAIWDTHGALVFDSGNDLERITAQRYGIDFNNYSKDTLPDGWSQERGPEPEALALGIISVPGPDGEPEDRNYAFIGLEKMGGIMAYDITDPVHPDFVTYVNMRDPTLHPEREDETADLALESLVFLSAQDSPTGAPLVIAGNEASGNVSIYAISINP